MNDALAGRVASRESRHVGYPLDVVEQGRKLVAEGKTLEEVRTLTGKHVSQKTYEKWVEKAEKDRPKVDDMVTMINVQFDKLDAIDKQRARLNAEESEIRKFLAAFNINQRPQLANTPTA